MPRLELFFLGEPQIVLDGAPLSLERRKATALLAYLALSRGPVARAKLADLFWPDYPAESAFSYLRRGLWELKSILGEGWLEAGREQVSLAGRPELWVDVHVFQGLLERCKPGIFSAECLAALEEAAALYRGDFLARFALPDCPDFEEWQLEQAESLRRIYAETLEKLARGYEEGGEFDKSLSYAKRWLALDSLEEAAHRQMMRLYARQGQRLAALRQYEACVQALQKELGVAPQAETVTLAEQIRAGIIEPPQPEPPRPALESRPQGSPPPRLNLPVQFTPFVGRHTELKEIGLLLRSPDVRLLTLTGPGGIGKTRLAVQSALQENEVFADGVCFVPLVGVNEAANIPAALAKSLQLPVESAEIFRRVCDYLHPRRMLLILDNFEHLIDDESVKIPTELAAAGDGIKVLVTSRERLNISGEQVYPVTGMRVPPPRPAGENAPGLETYSSVRLFVQSARRLQPAFQLDSSNAGAVSDLCRSVQGMPLAIELSAGWSGLLSPVEILDEFQCCLDFLETNRRDVPERQRSIRAVFESSWKLLTPGEAGHFNALSVFKGSFTRQGAQEVAGASIADLGALENKSLLQVRSQGRYEIHPLLAEYAAERLSQDPDAWQDAHDRHTAYYFDLLARLGNDLTGPRQVPVLAELEAEFENLNAAWSWAVEHRQFETLDRGLLPLFLVYDIDYIAADDLLDTAIRALEALPAPGTLHSLLLAKLLVLRGSSSADSSSALPSAYLRRALQLVRQVHGEQQMGIFYAFIANSYGWREDHLEGLKLMQEALGYLRQANQPWPMAATLRMLGQQFSHLGRRAEAIAAFSEAVSIARLNGDKFSEAYGLLDLGDVYRGLFDNSQTFQYCQEALKLSEELGSKAIASGIHRLLADTYSDEGDTEKAIAHYQEAEKNLLDIGNPAAAAYTMSFESIFSARQGDLARARQVRLKSLAISIENQDRNGILWSKWELGEIERLEGHFVAARQLYEESRRLFEDNKSYSLLPFYYRGLGEIALAEGRIEEARELFNQSLEYARQGYYRWAAAYAQCDLGHAALSLGQPEVARRHFQEAVEDAASIANRSLALMALGGLARLSANQEQPQAAVELAAFVLGQPAAWREIRLRAAEVLQAAGAMLDDAARAAAEEQGKGMTLKNILERFGIRTEGG
jgi:predicted ATPase/DNA-binding SARP family transcriptional activator